MYHRCLVLRSDVAGLWHSLADALEKNNEHDAAAAASAWVRRTRIAVIH